MALLGTVLLTLDHAAPAAVSANAMPIAIGALALIVWRGSRSFHSVSRLRRQACSNASKCVLQRVCRQWGGEPRLSATHRLAASTAAATRRHCTLTLECA